MQPTAVLPSYHPIGINKAVRVRMAARGAGGHPSNHVGSRNCKASNSVFESPFGTAASYRGADLFAVYKAVA